MRSASALGPTVLVEVGYNDPADEFAQRVEDAINALLAAGVQRILWANMREWQQQYIGMNQILVDAAARHPQVTIIDWEGYSHDHYAWFQGDGIHLVYDGAIGMATLFNSAIKQALAPPPQRRFQPPLAVTIADDAVAGGARRQALLGTPGGGGRRCPVQLACHLGSAAERDASPRERPDHRYATPAWRVALVLQAADREGEKAVRRASLVIE